MKKNKIVWSWITSVCEAYISKNAKSFDIWVKKRVSGLFVLNVIVLLMVLLGSAGYFDPFLKLTTNIIVFLSLVCAVFLLKLTSREVFSLSLLFLLLCMVLSSLRIDIWSERASIYLFESFAVGVVLLLIEEFAMMFKKNER